MRRLLNFLEHRRIDRDIADEIEIHLQERVDELVASGIDEHKARQQANRELGNAARVREDARAVWRTAWFDALCQDVRYALRGLRRNPGFTIVVLVTLALGIGMNAAVFSVIRATLLRPLQYPDADRLVWLADYDYLYEHRDNYVSRPAYLQWRENAHSFEGMTAYGNQDLALMVDGESSQERIASITGEFWQIVGARPELGRLFSQAEGNAMVLSHALFQRRFGGDPRVIGKTVSVTGHPFVITGVLTHDFRFIFPQQFANGDEQRDIDGYIALKDPLLRLPALPVGPWEAAIRTLGPAPWNIHVVAKLKPDVSIERARAETETVYARAFEQYPSYKRNHVRLNFAGLKEKLVGESKRALIVLLAAVGFVAMIACVNIANLLIARASSRYREIAIRAAVGAGRARVVRQLLTESVVLALLGGAAGLLVAQWGIKATVRFAPQAIPRLTEARIDGGVLAFTLFLSLATGFLFGLGPAFSIWKASLHDTLKSDAGTSTTSAGRLRTRGLLVAAQLALAVVLLTGAGLMLKSFWRMNAHAPGFEPEKILTMRVALSGSNYDAWLAKAAYIDRLLQRAEAMPGVEAVGVDRGSLNGSVKIRGGNRAASGESVFAAIRAVSPGYLRAMGVPLLGGAWPRRGQLFGVLVNESFARSIAKHGNAVGSHVEGSVLNDDIVGVVADFKYRQLDAPPSPEVYMPFERFPMGRSIKVAIRTNGDPRPIAPLLRTATAEIDSTQPAYELQTLEQALSDSIAPRRFNLGLMGVFAITALLMGLVGIHGLVAYTVAQRNHEIGIRMALGASRNQVVRMIVGQGMGVVLLGITVGLAGAFGLTGFIRSLLYEVQPNDPLTLFTVASTLAIVALAGSSLPALRAALVDPIIALRYQ
jgi:putative ABC transport system permease protein